MAEFRQYSTKNKVTTKANFDSLDKSTLSIGEQYSIVGPLEKDDLSTDIQNSLTKADNAFVAPTNDSTATDGQVLTKTAGGSEWKNSKTNTTYRGNVITGTSTTATIFQNSGIENANVDDWYINIDNGNVYKCTVAGPASVAKWVYNNTQAILSNGSYSEELHMGIGTWADDTTGYGAFLTQEVGGAGRLDLIGVLNYLNKIYPSNETSTFFLPDVETGTFAMTSDLPTVINKPYTGTPTFTTDEMSQIIRNFRNTIILLQYTGAFNGDYFLYPDSRQDSNTCVFVSQGSRSFAGPLGQGIIQLVITKAPDGTGTGTISLKAVVSTSDNNTFTGTNTFNSTLTAKSGATVPGSGMDKTVYKHHQIAITNPSLGTATYNFETKSGFTGTVATKEHDCFTYIEKTAGFVSSTISLSFTEDEATKIYNNFERIILKVLVSDSGAHPVIHLYPYGFNATSSTQKYCIFVSPVYNEYQYVLTMSITSGQTSNGSLSKVAVGGTGDVTAAGNNTFTGTNTFTGGFSVQRDSSNNINIYDTQLSRLKGGINLTYTFPNESGVLMVRPNENPTEDSVAVISSSGTVSYKKLSELSGGGTSVASALRNTFNDVY